MKSILTVFFCIYSLSLLAQGEGNSLKGVPLKERIVVGGGFGLGFGSLQDYVMVSPSVGYMLTKKFMGGVGITYRYTKYKYSTPAMSFNDYGASPFLRYMIFKSIFLQTEYEYLNYDSFEGRKPYNSFLAGGGFIQPIGDRASFYITALYNFSYSSPLPGVYSPYSSPLVIRAGISLGMFGN